jgi:hypothetical protein
MKKVIYGLIIMLLMLPTLVFAGSGKITVASPSVVAVGNSITVTVTLSGGDIGSWEMKLNYDSNYLKLQSSTAESGGVAMAGSSTKGISSKSYTFKFKALKAGNTKVTVGSYDAYHFSNFQEMNLSSSGKNIEIKTQQQIEASYSKDNYLKKLAINGFELTPGFNKDTLSYSVVVPEDTKSVTIVATKNDNKATVHGDGEVEVNLGLNVISITVKAQNGSERVYKINVEVKDSNPINVTVAGTDYVVIKKNTDLKKPLDFEESTIKIGEFDIPAFYNESVDMYLVGLKDAEGNIELFIYKDGEYTKYNEIVSNDFVFIYKDSYKNLPVELENYKKVNETISGNKVEVLKYSDKSKTSIIYGTNLDTGKEGFYVYDKDNNSMAAYEAEYTLSLIKQNNMFLKIIYGLFGLVVFLLLIIIILLSKKSKKRKPVVQETVTHELDDEIVVNSKPAKNNRKKNKKKGKEKNEKSKKEEKNNEEFAEI